jgi:hypothetical protein
MEKRFMQILMIVTNYHYLSFPCMFTFVRIGPCEGKWIQNLLL